MDTNNQNEHFKFNFCKMEFEATNPGKESTKHLCLIWGLIILTLVIFLLLAAWLKLNVWPISVAGTGNWIYNALRKKPP